MKIVQEGFKDQRKRFNPPKSPDGFEWPHAATPAQKRAFASSLKRLTDARGMEVLDLAKRITGEIVNSAGFRTARDGQSFRNFFAGKSVPREKMAAILATYFDVSLAELLGEAKNGHTNGNGHAHASGESEIRVKGKRGKKAAQPAAVPARELPEGAKPVFLKMETFAEDARFVSVFVTGTMPIDDALSLMSLLDPMHRKPPTSD